MRQTINLSEEDVEEAVEAWLKAKFGSGKFEVHVSAEMESVGYGMDEHQEPKVNIYAIREG